MAREALALDFLAELAAVAGDDFLTERREVLIISSRSSRYVGRYLVKRENEREREIDRIEMRNNVA